MPSTIARLCLFIISAFLLPVLKAETPPLLAKAVAQWDAGQMDLAFTQQGAKLDDKDQAEKTWGERYDPSLPDAQRWQLLELDGRTPSTEERTKWESKKNNRPRKKALKSLSDYLDLSNAKVVEDNNKSTRFELGLRSDALKLGEVEQLLVLITVDKAKADIIHIAATLREPMKIALGIAKVTDVDFDLHIETTETEPNKNADNQVKSGSTAQAVLFKFGHPIAYKWSDFKRVTPYAASKAESKSDGQR